MAYRCCVAEILPIRRKTLYIINFLKEVCYSHGFGAYIVIKWYYTCNHTVHQQTVSLLVEGLFYSPKKDNADSVADAYISNTRFGLCIFCGTFERSNQIIKVLIFDSAYVLNVFNMMWSCMVAVWHNLIDTWSLVIKCTISSSMLSVFMIKIRSLLKFCSLLHDLLCLCTYWNFIIQNDRLKWCKDFK